MSLQVCHCGWSKVTTYQGLRTHQGMMGCTAKGMRIPESDQFRFNYLPQITYTVPPIKLEDPEADIFTPSLEFDSSADVSLQVCHCGWSKETTYHGLRTHQGMMGCTPKGMRIPESKQPSWKTLPIEPAPKESSAVASAPVKKENVPVSPNSAHMGRAEAAVIEFVKSRMRYDCSSFTAEGLKEPNKPFFQTPQRPHRTAVSSGKARRALDFSTGAQQGEQVVWGPPTTTAQQTAVYPKEEEREKEREAQKLLKARQDRRKAELQRKIQTREHNVAEVRRSVRGCKGSLDAEWLEINNVFSEVVEVVEVARQRALQPLEERRRRVKKEAKDLVQKLEREIDKLKMDIEELDKNPDLQVSLDEPSDWKNLSVDTSFSFGSLRTTTAAMMEQLHQKLEKLSSVELKRIPKFAVDVTLDPATAHHSLVLSDDGKEVRDGGRSRRLPDAPERFDMFGSVLGLNSLTSGRSYWEVEVSGKAGWDLGVARGDANRKGKVSLSPDDGYWVTVHYEDEKYAALTAPPASLSLRERPERVGVFVDYEEGLVSFYDAAARSHIYSFTGCSFGGEIVPYFSLHLKSNGKNSSPLIISVVKRQ